MEMSNWNEYVSENGRCCACEAPMKDSKHLNLITLDKAANWEFPTWGNVSAKRAEDRKGVRAVAIICDDCVENKTLVKFAIEVEIVGHETVIRYHDITTLRDMSPITEKDLKNG